MSVSSTDILRERFKDLPRDIHPFLSDEDVYSHNEYYKYITSGAYNIECTLIDAAKYLAEQGKTAKSIVDLGCGRGGVLFMAHELGLKASGVELRQEYVDQFKQLQTTFPQYNDIEVSQGDIMNWAPTEPVDIIYTYKPIKDNKLWKQFLTNLTSTLDDGQVVVFQLDAPRHLYKRITGSICVVDKSCKPFNIEDLNRQHFPKGNAIRLIGGRYIYQIEKGESNIYHRVIEGTYITKEPPVFNEKTWEWEAEVERLD